MRDTPTGGIESLPDDEQDYPGWTFPTVETPPPASSMGLSANDICESIMDFDHSNVDNETIFYTFSEVVKNRKLFIGGFLVIAAAKLRDIIEEIKWENAYYDGPHVPYYEKEWEALTELGDMLETIE